MYYLCSHASVTKRKLDPRAIKYVFLGCSSAQKWYKCYYPSKKIFMHPLMWSLLRPSLSLTNLILSKRLYWKIREIWETHFLTFLPCLLTLCLYYELSNWTEDHNSQNELESQPIQDPCFTQVYLKRKNSNSGPKQVQELELSVGSEVNSKNHCCFDIDIPIALRKGTR